MQEEGEVLMVVQAVRVWGYSLLLLGRQIVPHGDKHHQFLNDLLTVTSTACSFKTPSPTLTAPAPALMLEHGSTVGSMNTATAPSLSTTITAKSVGEIRCEALRAWRHMLHGCCC